MGDPRNRLKEMQRQQAANPQAFGGSDANQRFQEIPDVPPENSTENLQLEARSAILHRALNLVRPDFEEKTWEAFWRLAISKERASDIAADLGMSTKAVRQAKYRVSRRLREEFSELE